MPLPSGSGKTTSVGTAERQKLILTAVATRIQRTTGHQVLVAPAPEDFNEDGDLIEVRLDGELLGGFGFHWHESWDEDKATAELRGAMSVLLDEEFPEGWW